MLCWKCGKDIGSGYIVEVRLIGGGVEEPITAVTAPLCWPCIKAVNEALGEQHPKARHQPLTDVAI